jgi:hypothetical protein
MCKLIKLNLGTDLPTIALLRLIGYVLVCFLCLFIRRFNVFRFVCSKEMSRKLGGGFNFAGREWINRNCKVAIV